MVHVMMIQCMHWQNDTFGACLNGQNKLANHRWNGSRANQLSPGRDNRATVPDQVSLVSRHVITLGISPQYQIEIQPNATSSDIHGTSGEAREVLPTGPKGYLFPGALSLGVTKV